MKASKATAMLGIVALGSFAVACGGGDSTEGTGSGENACPQKLTIQTDWFPELEHGGTYQLIGPGGTANKETVSYSGPVQEQYAVEIGRAHV